MTLILDCIVVAILLFTCFVGYKRGFVKTLIGLFKSIGAFILAFIFSDKLGVFINNRFIGNVVQSKISNMLSGYINVSDDGGIALKVNTYFENMPGIMRKTYSGIGITPEKVVDTISEKGIEAASHSLAQPIGEIISRILAFAIIFLAIILAATLLANMLDLVFKLPVLSQFNKLFGLIFGLVKGLIYCFLIISLITSLFPYLQSIDFLGAASGSIDNTKVFKALSDINPLNKLF